MNINGGGVNELKCLTLQTHKDKIRVFNQKDIAVIVQIKDRE